MTLYRVECGGEVRRVFEVEAADPEEAAQCWPYHGVPIDTAVIDLHPVDVREVFE